MTIGLPNIDRFKDRHGRERHYYRPPGGKRVPLPDPGDPGFRAAYHAAAGGKREPIGKRAAPAGTFAKLIAEYYASSDFRGMRASSQVVVRSSLEAFARDHGHRAVADLERKHVSRIIGDMAEKPGAANNLLRRLRTLMAFAIANGYRADDPTAKVKAYKPGHHHTWTEDELAQYEARWPVGTRERTAYALALYTGQRRGDIARMTWRDYDEAAGVIHVVQQKTGAKLEIPVHARLREMLATWPREHLMIFVTDRGAPFAPAGFGLFVAAAIDAAGLPDRCVLHGLRKAAARRLAEAGCSTKQIAAVTGHQSLQQIENYTRAAAQRVLATAAIGRLESQPAQTQFPTRRLTGGED